jgi:hypothetical protein
MSRGRRLNGSTCAVEHGEAELTFQEPDLHGQVRLGDAELGGPRRETRQWRRYGPGSAAAGVPR